MNKQVKDVGQMENKYNDLYERSSLHQALSQTDVSRGLHDTTSFKFCTANSDL